MHAKLAFLLAFLLALTSSRLAFAAYDSEPVGVVRREVEPRQTSNPGGPIQSVPAPSSVTDEGTTGVMSIQTDTSVTLSIQTDTVTGDDDSTTSPTPSDSNALSSVTETSSSSETSSTPSSSVSDAKAASPLETGYAVAAAAAAAGFVGVIAAL